jgi:formyltetrahydrofolate deformylase
VFALARFILEHGGNILHADQHQDASLGLFFMRIEWSLTGFDLDQERLRGPLLRWQRIMDSAGSW